MILTQKYHSASEIDAEFIPGLEGLLREFFPSFKWLVQMEKLEPESTYFTYYLFFGNKHNAPVGFAGLSIQKCSHSTSWLKKLLNKTETPKKYVDWSIQSSSEEAIVFDPMYVRDGVKKTKELIDSYFKRDDISWQTITFSRAYSEMSTVNNLSERSEKKIANTLIKSGNNYQHYLMERPLKLQKAIKLGWKELYSSLNFDIGDFNSFKSVFEYRKNGQELYKKLKKDPRILIHTKESINYVTFEKEGEIQALIFLIHGVKGHLFFDWVLYNSSVSKEMLIQLCIMKFYEFDEFTYLHPLTQESYSKELERVGFSERSLLQINFKRSHEYA